MPVGRFYYFLEENDEDVNIIANISKLVNLPFVTIMDIVLGRYVSKAPTIAQDETILSPEVWMYNVGLWKHCCILCLFISSIWTALQLEVDSKSLSAILKKFSDKHF